MKLSLKFIAFVIFSVVSDTEVKNPKSLVLYGCDGTMTYYIDNYSVECYLESGIYFIEILCHGHLLADIPDIKIYLHFVGQISFYTCAFSSTDIVQNIVESMEARYDRIRFHGLANNPTRVNFQNFSAPTLNIGGSNTNELPYDLLYDVTNVRSLIIYRTNIVSIPKRFFNDWAKDLLETHVWGNKIQKITKNDLLHLVNVAYLDLSENEINEIEQGAFDNLKRLQLIILTQNRLHTLPSGILHKLTGMTAFYLMSHLSLEYNEVLINETFFTTLNNSQLRSLPSDTFEGLSELLRIEVVGHDLRSLPVGLFDDNENLERLKLSRNNLEFLPEDIFRNLKYLRSLYLYGNRLTTLTLQVFSNLHSLEVFNVGENNLKHINAEILTYFPLATNIDFSFNNIEEIELPFQIDESPPTMIQNISYINIYENQNFHRLILNLSFNSFSELNYDVINVLKYNISVDLRYNAIGKINLTKLTSGTPRLDQLEINQAPTDYKKVYVGHNPLVCDCQLMDFIRFLNKSNHHEIQNSVRILAAPDINFGEGFECSLPIELKERDVRKVHLDEFHCQFKAVAFEDACTETCICQQYPVKRFLSVDCSYKNLTQLPIMNNNKLNWSIELNMSGNSLEHIPALDHSYLINIQKLDLSSNNITKVTLGVFSPTLRELELHNNSISRLDSSIIEHLTGDNPLRSLTIHNNKWICDCETHKILQSSIRKKLQNYNFHEVVCYGTARKLYEVTVSELCKETNIVIVGASLLVAFFGILIGSFAALYYRYQKQIKIWLYSRNLCLRFITDDELDKDKQYDAFISFSHKDEDFVEKEIVAKLEEGPRPYKLCLHYRDWLAGEWIPLQISRSVADSRRTIIILTPNFLESVWGLVEFRTAHIQALKDGRARLIVIVLEEVANHKDLDEELKNYLSLNTYVKWGDPRFWHKLKYALPHRLRGSRKIADHDSVNYRTTSIKNVSDCDGAEVITIN